MPHERWMFTKQYLQYCLTHFHQKGLRTKNIKRNLPNPIQTTICKPQKIIQHWKLKKETELSIEYWQLKSKNETPNISRKKIGKYRSYSPESESKKCLICLNEKLEKIDSKSSPILNKRTEIITKSRHHNKFKFSNFAVGKKQ